MTLSAAAPIDAATAAYHDALQGLSEASVHRHFDPFVDIDWDAPENAITPDDPRWILPVEDPLGRHPWYQAQPVERQIEIGMWRQAGIAKVGLNFEQLLIRALTLYAFNLDNNDPEFRYVTHEVAEECNHTMMFQEMIDRIGHRDVVGMGPIDRLLGAVFITPSVKFFPELFFTMVLGGEEPIDHMQKEILRGSANLHPIMQRVMAIHVAEEARHISFAHQKLMQNVPKMHPATRFALSLLFPFTMRVMADMIMSPPKEFLERFDIPKSVIRDLYWRQPESQATLRNIFGDVRALAEHTGLMNPVSKLTWRAFGIAGKATRYRSEPVRAAA